MNWYYAIEGRSTGPVTESSLKRLAREGEISGATLVWHPGLEEWEPLAKLQPEIVGQVTRVMDAQEPASQDGTGVLKRIFSWGKKK